MRTATNLDDGVHCAAKGLAVQHDGALDTFDRPLRTAAVRGLGESTRRC